MFCPQCGKEVNEEQVFCHHCGTKLQQEELLFAPAEPESDGREKTAWEAREIRGFFPGLFSTLNDVLVRPSLFFRKMPVTGGISDPLLYALIIGMVGWMFSYLWQILSKSAMQGMVPGDHMFTGVWLALFAFFSPFLLIMGLFLSAGILHVCLMMVKGAKAGFEATFRVVAYGYSSYILLVIPFCGGLLAAVWAIVLSIIGLREAHQTSGGKAAFAVFLPAIVCCGIIMLALAIFLGAAAGSLGMILEQLKQ